MKLKLQFQYINLVYSPPESYFSMKENNPIVLSTVCS